MDVLLHPRERHFQKDFGILMKAIGQSIAVEDDVLGILADYQTESRSAIKKRRSLCAALL